MTLKQKQAVQADLRMYVSAITRIKDEGELTDNLREIIFTANGMRLLMGDTEDMSEILRGQAKELTEKKPG